MIPLALALCACVPPNVADLEQMLSIAIYNICGPEGYHDWTDEGPTCEREGWSRVEGRYVVPAREVPARRRIRG
jgi:hypothetical protein